MNLLRLFFSQGRFNRVQYNIIELICTALNLVLLALIFINPIYLLAAIPSWILLWFIHIQSTIKRLHDLGRAEDGHEKLFIPLVGAFLDWRLHFQGGRKEKDIETNTD